MMKTHSELTFILFILFSDIPFAIGSNNYTIYAR